MFWIVNKKFLGKLYISLFVSLCADVLISSNSYLLWLASLLNLTIIGSDNGLSPAQHQAIIWTRAGILLIGPLETNFSQILIKIYTFSFKKMHLKMSSGQCGHFVSASMS